MTKITNNFSANQMNNQPKKRNFEIQPLDINLAKIQYSLISRLEKEVPENGDFCPVVERYFSKDPTLDLSEIKVSCEYLKSDDKKNGDRVLKIAVSNKALTKEKTFPLFNGKKEEIIDYINNPDFFATCKSLANSAFVCK